MSPTIEIETISQRLLERISSYPSCVVAFSGGVDSAVVAQAAHLALGEAAVAITGRSPSVSLEDLRSANDCAAAIGIRHLTLDTSELHDARYAVNDHRRCYHCKSHLYEILGKWATANRVSVILSGTNADDLSDYRPGLEAASQHAVQAPLAELGITKTMVRSLATYWQLPVADRPASPCLASRVAYGESISEDKLRRIEAAESWLREQGFKDIRVRLHGGDLARIEIRLDQWDRITEISTRDAINQTFRQLGFHFVTLDLAGRQSGSLNRLLPVLS